MSTTTEPTPPTDPMLVSVNQAANPNDKPLTIAVVDQSRDINAAARDYVETRIREENYEFAENHGKIRKLLHNIWRGENGIATPYVRNKYYEEGKRIAKENGITSLYTDDKSLWEAATGATIDRFASEYDESIHLEAGERRKDLADDSPFGKSVKKLIENFAKGDSRLGDKKSFDEAKNRILRQLNQYGNGDGLIGEGDLKIDNIWEIAQAVKERIDHGESVDAVIQGMKIYSGESRSGVRTEAYQSKVDKVVEKVQSSRVGSLVRPGTIGLAAAVATGVWRVGKGSLVKALGVTVLPGGLTGVLSGVRECRRLGKERSVHSREMAQGGSFDNESRREEMDKYRYNTVSAEHLTNSLREFIDRDDPSPEELQKGYESLVEAASRTAMSDRERADFISYSSAENVEIERFDLDVAIAEAKVKLKGKLGELPEEFRRDLGIDKNDTISDAINKSTELMQSLSEDKNKKDQLFKRLRWKNTAKSAAIGFGSGLLASVAVQEVAALFTSGYDGLLERAISDDTKGGRQTVLDAIFHREGSSGNTILSSDTYSSHSIGNGDGNVKLPDNYKFTYNDDGTANIIGPDNKLFAHNISFEANGSLSQSSQEYLQGKGVVIENLSSTVDGKELMSRDLSVNEYLDHYQSKTTNITRDFWYDNNTPGVSDGNELNLHWEERGADGSIRLSIADMTNDGSYYGYDSASWSDGVQNGSLKFAVSASIDNQDRVFMVDIAPDGSINIPPDSPAASLFSVDEHGHMEFNGAYGEVVSVQDVDSDGITHVAPMATMEGNNSITTIPTPVEVPTSHISYETKMTFPPMEVSKPNVVEGFGLPLPWIVTRKPLERLNKKEDPFTYNYYGYGENRDLQWMRKWVSGMGGPRTRRQVEDASGKKHWVEADGSPVVRSVERERNTIYNYLNSEFSKNPEYKQKVASVMSSLGAMSDNCRVSVNIPAYMEVDNLDRLLSQYIDQTDNKGEALEQSLFEINILVNRKKGTPEDNSVKVIESFIEKYAKSHNGVRPVVHYANVELDPEDANVGFARKLLTDAVLQRSLDRNNQSQSLYIESEDADLIEVDKRTVFNLISKLDKNPHLDVVRGVEGRMTSMIRDNALLLTRRMAMETFLYNVGQEPFRNPKSPTWNSFCNRKITGGWNCGYSAEAYAMIGGYESVRAGEDLAIGEKVSMMRGDGDYPNLETVGRVPTLTESSPRRFIQSIATGKDPYGNFGETGVEDSIRKMSLQEAMESIKQYADITEANKSVFEDDIQGWYSWAQGATPTLEDAKMVTERVMRSMGFRNGDYVFNGKEIRVIDWSNIKRNIDDFRNMDPSKVKRARIIQGSAQVRRPREA